MVNVWVSDVPTIAPLGASTLVKALVPFDLTIPADNVVAPVPPEATGRVPEVPEDSVTGPHDGAADPFAVKTYPAVPAPNIAVVPEAVW